ncbi:MAG: twin-arginine translocase TatA/TatE family subunit [Planctomycetota bacterium]
MPSLILANLESPWVILLLLVVVFMFFGHKLPEVARSLGSSVSEFKKGVKAGEEEVAAQAKKDEAEKK